MQLGGRWFGWRSAPWGAALALGVVLSSANAHGWILAEHTRLTHDAVAALPRTERDLFDALWKAARDQVPTNRQRLCSVVYLTDLVYETVGEDIVPGSEGSWCVSFSTLPALAADHSCSPSELEELVESGDWLLGVLRAGRDLASRIDGAEASPSALEDLRRGLDIDLQVEDHDYGDRAKVNTTHFLPPRRSNSLESYLADVLASGEEANAVAMWAAYHAAALHLAARATRCSHNRGEGQAPEPGCEAILWRVFQQEAFALHFLQDAFSAGHVVGAWGGAAQRKGTHDHYSRHGLDVRTWRGDDYVAYGDIFLSDEDVRRVVAASVTSIRQLTSVLAPWGRDDPRAEAEVEHAAALVAVAERAALSLDLDVCTRARVPAGLEPLAEAELVADVVRDWPRPPPRVPAMPRLSAEYGPFVSSSAGVLGAVLWPTTSGSLAEGEAGARLGLGAGWSGDGMLTSRMYGRVVLEALAAGVHNAARTDSALGLGFRVQAPYFLVPGDIVIWLPLAFWAGEAYMARQAALGGLLGLTSPFSLSEHVRMQLLIGREVSVVWFLPRGAEPERLPLRWDLSVPVVELAVDTPYHGGLGNRWATTLGLSYVDMGGGLAPFIGPYIAGSFQARYTP